MICTAAMLVVALIITPVLGHGRLVEPPSRATMWRFGFPNPPDYNDHESFCGGLTTLIRNKGKCGLCGDPYDAPTPRPHETGGHFGKGPIVRTYQEAQEMAVKVELTANHGGYFEFKVCPKSEGPQDEGCFQNHVLPTSGEQKLRYWVSGSTSYDLRYALPKGLTCVRCVLQWTYVAANNWGRCANGTEAVGCGPQETFRACADVTIRPHEPTSLGSRSPAPSALLALLGLLFHLVPFSSFAS